MSAIVSGGVGTEGLQSAWSTNTGQILRFRHKNGNFRVSASLESKFCDVAGEIAKHLPAQADGASLKVSDKPNGPFRGLSELDQTFRELGFKNGEMLFLDYEVGGGPAAPAQAQAEPLRELEVDQQLEKETGMIKREKSALCKHSDKGMCEYCSPLPPWDKSYREAHQIKHMSFHAYLKELNQNTNKANGSSYIKPLEESNYKINLRCNNGHEPWPRGICSKCQPGAITLQQQEFRMVDHVEFSNYEIVNKFIGSWRDSGKQRFGYLIGRYDRYDKVPLGIKAVVEAVYEPAQADEDDGITLFDEDETKLDAVLSQMNLQRVGVIFTDLTDAKQGNGSVLCKRHKDSFFLSSLEIINSALYQRKYPNITKYSSSNNRYSSKFITCVVSGNLDQEIDISSYQVSETAEALVEADLISGSTSPSFAYINETNDCRYVPDIFYNKINEYKLVVKENAKPAFPVDYLLVTLTHGFPQESRPVFLSNDFPTENRQYIGVSQDLAALKAHIQNPDNLSDFHFVVYLSSLDILSPAEMAHLTAYCATHDDQHRLRLLHSPGWQSLLAIVAHS